MSSQNAANKSGTDKMGMKDKYQQITQSNGNTILDQRAFSSDGSALLSQANAKQMFSANKNGLKGTLNQNQS
jgi:hypothetical protein